MGNELLNKEDKNVEESKDDSNDFIKYGVVTKKGEEKSNDDNYLLMPNLLTPEEGKKNEFSLFGVFDGHNSGFIPKCLVKNVPKFYENEILNINKNNYKIKIEEIFKNIDKEFKPEKNEGKKFKINEKSDEDEEEEEKDDAEKKDKYNNKINENKENEKKEEINYINVDVDKKEFNYIKNAIKNSKEIPEEFKEIDDNELENLLLFKNLFQYNNNYLYNNDNVNYIGSSASIVLINENSIITADLGITKCILFNKEGNILNTKENKESKNYGDYKVEHTFNNSEEKKRIKRFNKSVDYNSLKMNFYIPASRCFGFFKYKDNEILKEENQIISCVPDVYIYDKKDVDYILLITKGAAPTGDTLNKFMKKIKDINGNNEEQNNDKKDKDIKLSDLINEYLKYKKEEVDKSNTTKITNNPSGSVNKTTNKANTSIYIGKEDFGEENAIINELNNSYYKDIMSLNKTNDCHGNYNSTCILIQLLKNKVNVQNENKKDNNKVEEENKGTEKNTGEENKKEEKEDKKNENEKIEENKVDNMEKKDEEEKIKNGKEIKEDNKNQDEIKKVEQKENKI